MTHNLIMTCARRYGMRACTCEVHARMCECLRVKRHLVVLKELQQEGRHGGSDADEEVDDDEEDVRRAGHLEPEGGWVHYGCN